MHSCGTVPPHGFEELRHPEQDFYVVGMKSYGRAPTFLLLTGYEQVRSVVAALTGDLEAARRVELRPPRDGRLLLGHHRARSGCVLRSQPAGCPDPLAALRSPGVLLNRTGTPPGALRRGIYYGWPMLMGLSLGETVSWGVVYYAFSVFISPMEVEFGWTRAQVTGAFSLALLVSGVAAVPVGHWLDRRGPRALMTLGSALAALLLYAWSRVDSLVALYAIWAGLGLAMAAVLYEPAFAVVATWFDRHRARALTILTVFGGLASTVFVPLATGLLGRLGWRGAVATLALILACTTVPLHALVLRRHPHDLGWEVDGEAFPRPLDATEREREGPPTLSAAVSSPAFRTLSVVFILNSLATVGVSVHLIPYLVGAHVPGATAAAAVGLMGAMQLPGRLFYASVRRRLPAESAIATVLVVQAAALALLPWVSGGATLFGFAAGFGMASGVATLLRASTVAEAFDIRHYGRVSGLLALSSTAARAVAPILVALVYGLTASYTPAFIGLAGLMAVAAAWVASGRLLEERSRPGTPAAKE